MTDVDDVPRGAGDMAVVAETRTADQLDRLWDDPPGLRGQLTGVQNGKIGTRLLLTGFFFLLLGGTFDSLVMRLQLAFSEQELVSPAVLPAKFTQRTSTPAGFAPPLSVEHPTHVRRVRRPSFQPRARGAVPVCSGAQRVALPRLCMSITEGGNMSNEGQQDVVAVLEQDHREVERMFSELEKLKGSLDPAGQQRRKELTEQVVIELVRHSVAEEAEVYPRIHERVDEAEADRLVREQAEAEEVMKKLEKLSPDQPDFDAELSRLMTAIKEHVAEEEEQAFPRLRSTFSHDELVEMGRKVESVKKMAPTRPHPSAPDHPPGDKLLGPMAGLVDRMRDALTGRGAS